MSHASAQEQVETLTRQVKMFESYFEGRDAAFDPACPPNPYPPDSQDHSNWYRGWEEARVLVEQGKVISSVKTLLNAFAELTKQIGD